MEDGRPESHIGAFTCPMHPEVRREGPGACPMCGMALEPLIAADEEASPELRDMTRRFWVSAALALPVFALSMAEMIPGGIVASAGPALWIQFVLTTPVVVWGGRPIFERGWASVVNRRLNMFTLIAVGVGAAYSYSVFALFLPGWLPQSLVESHGGPQLYFESAAVVTALVLLGQMLELRARSRTSSAIRLLMKLAPETARVMRADGGEEDVPLEQVRVGERLRVRPGERVPVDGVVLEGASAVDESLVTGEAIPVEKNAGSAVTGGTINGNGAFVMQAERVGGDTMLARIVRMVEEAQRSRAPIQHVADAVASYFVPAVILVAAVTFVVWAVAGPAPRLAHALVNAIAVLIVACPCALGLATPMSVMVGMGRGATAGILMRNAEALETLEKIDTLVIDKTGTLTEGKPRLVEIVALPGRDGDEVLRLAASVERASEHPLATAIVTAAMERGLKLSDADGFRSWTGRGIVGKVEGKPVAIGNRRLFQELGIEAVALSGAVGQGRSSVLVAIDGKAAGALRVADPIKPSTREAIRLLHDEGIRIVMLTGDSRGVAEAVAAELGIDEVVAEALPDEKGDVVKRLQREGRSVAMAGDGINDAPALAQAHLGIAMGSGADVALESADMTLVKGDLRGIARARNLSRATMRNIRQNLFFAFVYNALAVPIAAGALYPALGLLLSPMIAGAAMSFSSVSVVWNALRLRKVRL